MNIWISREGAKVYTKGMCQKHVLEGGGITVETGRVEGVWGGGQE